MDALRIAKRRARLRRDQAGAAMFVVAMTLAVLASVGVYALAAASTEVKTSGYERQNTQTHYLTEYAIVGAAHYLSGTMVTWTAAAMQTTPDTCPLSLPGVSSSADTLIRGCRRIPASEMSQPWAAPYFVAYAAGTAPLSSTIQPGSFGPVQMRGDFFVELTEP